MTSTLWVLMGSGLRFRDHLVHDASQPPFCPSLRFQVRLTKIQKYCDLCPVRPFWEQRKAMISFAKRFIRNQPREHTTAAPKQAHPPFTLTSMQACTSFALPMQETRSVAWFVVDWPSGFAERHMRTPGLQHRMRQGSMTMHSKFHVPLGATLHQ